MAVEGGKLEAFSKHINQLPTGFHSAGERVNGVKYCVAPYNFTFYLFIIVLTINIGILLDFSFLVRILSLG